MDQTLLQCGARPRRSGDLARRARRGSSSVAVLLLAGGLLVGCGADEDGGPSAGSAAPTTPAPTSTPATASGDGNGTGDGGQGRDGEGDGAARPPFPADTGPDTREASGDAFGTLTDVRIGHHDGFDRVVFEFGGAGTPGWDVRYAARPARQGSGEAVDLAGDATLQVTITGVGHPSDTGVEEYSGPRRLAVAATDVVTEVFFDGTFEGTTAALVGTEAERPFRVYLLPEPVRIVLEVADAP